MLYLCLALPSFLCLLVWCRQQRVEPAVAAVLFGGFGLAMLLFYRTGWQDFSADPDAHAGYVAYIVRNHTLPTLEENAAARHPPSYYWIGALLYRLAERAGEALPMNDVRHLSAMCYLLFLFLGARLILGLLPPGVPRVAALALLCFWPVGFALPGRITCDLWFYVGEAGVLLALTDWLRFKRVQAMTAAFFWSGVSLLGKNPGVIMLATTAGLFLWGCLRDVETRIFLRSRALWLSIAFALLSAATSIWHGWISTNMTYNPDQSWSAFLRLIGGFNPFLLLYDTDMGLSGDLFWNRLLHSLLLGDNLPWRAPNLLLIYNVIWAAMLVYLITGIPYLRRLPGSERRVFAFYGVISALWVVSMIAIRFRTGNPMYADARYIYPVILPLALTYGRVMAVAQARGNAVLFRAGGGMVVIFVLLGGILIASQWLSPPIIHPQVGIDFLLPHEDNSSP